MRLRPKPSALLSLCPGSNSSSLSPIFTSPTRSIHSNLLAFSTRILSLSLLCPNASSLRRSIAPLPSATAIASHPSFSRHFTSSSTLSSSSSILPSTSHPPSPLRVAVVGSGPAAFYTVKYLLKEHPDSHIHIFERLPTPFGLVRFGVSPDHPDVKSVQNEFNSILADERVHFHGNVQIGNTKEDASKEVATAQLTLTDLRSHFHIVVLAYGAQSEKVLSSLPHSSLSGIHPARHFVNWYNGHPDAANMSFHLDSTDTAVVVGQGNVAVDIARILLAPIPALMKTDIAQHALEQLAHSRIKRVVMVGRRGAIQSAFTIGELRELTQINGVRPIITRSDFDKSLNQASLDEVQSSRPKKRKLELLQSIADSSTTSSSELNHRFLEIRFFLSPLSFHPSSSDPSRVGGISFERTTLRGVAEQQEAVGIGEEEKIETGLIFQSIGYKSAGIAEEVAFDERKGIVKNEKGRVFAATTTANQSEGSILTGVYVSGWLKRGPSGIIGTNIVDARETVKTIMEDVRAGRINEIDSIPPYERWNTLMGAPEYAGRVVSSEGWKRIEMEEERRGKEKGKPREKIVNREELLRIAHTK